MKLIIIESPNKIKKLASFLSSDYKVVATKGHCIDLPTKSLAIDIKNGFKPTYTIIPGKEGTLKEIIELAKQADVCYISTDPDREGEFIGYAISTRLPKNVPQKRATFHSITQKEVLDGIKNAGNINLNLISAQMSRRILDRLVGYKTSPHCMRFVAGAKSAGRCQSATLRLICEREDEIEAFIPKEYWDLSGKFKLGSTEILAVLKKPEFGFTDEKSYDPKKLPAFKVYCEKTPWIAEDVVVSDERNNPLPPFTTSSLQQAASSILGWGAKKTMNCAQSLFSKGKISYHRTDSNILSPDFLQAARNYVSSLGSNYLPAQPNLYKSKAVNTQEAHEACRVTDINDQNFTQDDEGKLYELIWRRSISSQMTPAVFTKTKVVFQDDPKKFCVFESLTKICKFDGHLKVWTYSKPSVANPPQVTKGQKYTLQELITEQKFTTGPGRYSDGGSLTKKLEELGIGRPATLATMTSVLEERNYVTKDGNSLKPTPLGRRLIKFLKDAKFSFIDYNYTSLVENDLDEISNGKKKRLDVLTQFWGTLEQELKSSSAAILAAIPQTYKHPCPTCSGPLTEKSGKFGPYVMCSKEGCTFKSSLDINGEFKKKANSEEAGACPLCGGKTFKKEHPKFGGYISCENWKPKKAKVPGTCTYTAQISKEGKVQEKKPAEVVPGIKCPKCSKDILKRKSRFGQEFYGCSGYPKCKTIVNEDGTIKPPSPRGGRKKKKGSDNPEAPKD